MRSGTLALVIAGMSAGAIAAGLTLDGLVGASLLLLGPALAALSIGLGVSVFLERMEHRADSPRRRDRKRPYRCARCGGERVIVGYVWVCTSCDGVSPGSA